MIEVVFEITCRGGKQRKSMRKKIAMPFITAGMFVKLLPDEFDGNWMKAEAVFYDPDLHELTATLESIFFDEEHFDKEVEFMVSEGFSFAQNNDATSSKAT